MSVPWEEPALALVKVGPLVRLSVLLLPSVKVSAKVTPDKVTLPLFSSVIV